MAHADKTVTISRPPEQVFDFLADGSNNGRWRTGVIEVAHLSGEGVGAVWHQTLRGPGGRSIQGDYRVTQHDRPHRLAFEVIAGPARPTGIFALAPNGTSGTSLTFTLDLQPHGIMRLMAPMVQRRMTKELAALDELKRVLETP